MSVAFAEGPAVLGDLDGLGPEKLSKEQLDQLIPKAKMSRIAPTGSTTDRRSPDPPEWRTRVFRC
jgi:hypothetical protein